MKRVLVIALGIWDKQALALPHVATDHQFTFIGEDFQERPSLLEALRFDVFEYVRRVVDQFRSAKLAGVVGAGDYPACMLAPLVAQELGLHAPRAQDVVVLNPDQLHDSQRFDQGDVLSVKARVPVRQRALEAILAERQKLTVRIDRVDRKIPKRMKQRARENASSASQLPSQASTAPSTVSGIECPPLMTACQKRF